MVKEVDDKFSIVLNADEPIEIPISMNQQLAVALVFMTRRNMKLTWPANKIPAGNNSSKYQVMVKF